jgi:Fe2+ transport system protein B
VENFVFIDTPGIHRKSDTETTRLAINELDENEFVLLVVQATQIDEDLEEMLPLVYRKRGLVVVSFWDKVQPGEASMEAIERLSRDSGVDFITIDGRKLSSDQIERIYNAIQDPRSFLKEKLTTRAGWRIEPPPGLIEHRVIGPSIALSLLLFPAFATIFGANAFANWLHPIVQGWVDPLIAWGNQSLPAFLRWILTAQQGDFGYGLLNMGPFLLVWALPSVLLFSIILGAYKASGLVERINVSLHPWVKPFGLSGRDVVRVVMGFGCNVPAVISTRACSQCSRSTAISAIAFGAACSYQLPATLAVLSIAASANGTSSLGLSMIFLGYLLLTTLVYLRLTSPRIARTSLNVLMTPQRPFLQWPTFAGLMREASSTIYQFFFRAMPVFVGICVLASLLARLGVLDYLSRTLAPLMSLFNLPSNAALPIVLASIRKDGIFLFAADDQLASPMTSVQVLTGVYLAGVLLPCLVTALTIMRETSWLSGLKMLLRQAAFAVGFTMILAWSGWLIVRYL